MIWIYSFLLCDAILLVQSQQISIDVNISQVFIQRISPDMLSWNDTERENDFHYVITSMEGPDLPSWIYTKYIKNDNSLYIFGAPPKDIDVKQLEISVTSLYSYRMKYCKLSLSIVPREEYAKHEIHLRISNANIEDMLNVNRQNSLIDIFESRFWPESKGKLYITFLAASEDVGFRLPVNPNDTAGVVIHLGSAINFSIPLYDLQNETAPLSKHCPSFYKSTTVEIYFRPKNFIIDWCLFKLVKLEDCVISTPLPEKNTAIESCGSVDHNETDYNLKNDEEFLIDKEKLPESPIFGMLILLVIIPSVFLGFIIASWLASFMCINNAKLTRNTIEENALEDEEFDHNQIFFQF